MSTIEFNPEKLANEYENESPEKIIKLALENFNNIAISFSGAEDVVLIDIAKKIQSDVKVFSLDTGRCGDLYAVRGSKSGACTGGIGLLLVRGARPRHGLGRASDTGARTGHSHPGNRALLW